MKRSEEIRRKIQEKDAEIIGLARDYRTQTSRLNNEIAQLNRELEEIKMGVLMAVKTDYEVRHEAKRRDREDHH